MSGHSIFYLHKGYSVFKILTLLGMNTTDGPHMSHVTLYTISVLPPRKFCGFHDRVTVYWSTKLTVKFCGADGGSIL